MAGSSIWISKKVSDRARSLVHVSLRYALVLGHTLAFQFNLQKGRADVSVVTRLVSQSPINDAAWHRVKVEVASNQIRFSVDDKTDVFYALTADDSLDESSFDREFVFGGAEE